MRIGRTLAPTAAPVGAAALAAATRAAAFGARAVPQIEAEFREYFGVPHALFFSSGKGALTILLQALHTPGRRGSVAIPAYTCYSVPAAVAKAGLRPVLVDVDPDSFDFESASLDRALADPDLLAVVPTHLFGIPADIDRVRALRRNRSVFIIEDAAQGLGVKTHGGALLGCDGDAAILSFGRGKHLSAGGGGAILTSDSEIAARVRHLGASLPADRSSWRALFALAAVDVLVSPSAYWLPAGLPFLGIGETIYSTEFELANMSDVTAITLTGWRQRLEEANKAREASCRWYTSELGLRPARECNQALLRFPVLVPPSDRKAVLSRGVKCGLGLSRMYPHAIHEIPALADHFRGQQFPGAERLANSLVTLPTHQFVTPGDRQQLATLLGDYTHGTRGAAASPRAAASY